MSKKPPLIQNSIGKNSKLIFETDSRCDKKIDKFIYYMRVFRGTYNSFNLGRLNRMRFNVIFRLDD